jgi:hypothetical protein
MGRDAADRATTDEFSIHIQFVVTVRTDRQRTTFNRALEVKESPRLHIAILCWRIFEPDPLGLPRYRKSFVHELKVHADRQVKGRERKFFDRKKSEPCDHK